VKILGYFLLMLVFTNTNGAPTVPNQDALNQIKQEGQFFSVQISKGEPIRIFVVGKEEANLDLSKLTVTVRRLKPYPGKVLKIDRLGGYFQVNDTKEFNSTTDLEISTKVESKDEVFKFNLKKNQP
jgi:hypothetical protein